MYESDMLTAYYWISSASLHPDLCRPLRGLYKCFCMARPGVSLRSTPGFTLSPAPRVQEARYRSRLSPLGFKKSRGLRLSRLMCGGGSARRPVAILSRAMPLDERKVIGA